MSAIRAPRRRAERTAVFVALVTAVVVNAVLVLLLQVINRQPESPGEPLPILHRLHTIPQVPTVAANQATTVTPLPTQAPAVAIALPRIELPPVATGAPLALPVLPTVATAQPVALPAIVAGTATGTASALAPDPTAMWRVDEPPVLVNGFDLERFYPRQARLRGIEGTTVLRLEIANDGSVTASSVLSSDPAEIFDAAAKALARSLHFTPARNRGAPVACAITQSVAWRLPR
jgi:periplasmic protein TonB